MAKLEEMLMHKAQLRKEIARLSELQTTERNLAKLKVCVVFMKYLDEQIARAAQEVTLYGSRASV